MGLLVVPLLLDDIRVEMSYTHRKRKIYTHYFL